MTQSLDAVFDGKVLRPDQPLDLKPNTRVRITIEYDKPSRKKSSSFLRTALSLNLEGPPDWSERIEEYLYGKSGDNGSGLP